MKPHEGQPMITVGLPLGQSHAAMIMLHGRNAAPRNIVELVPLLERPQFTYLAPAAAGGTWYPYSFMSDTATNQPGLSSALWVVGMLIADLVARGIQKDHIVLLGFSQGACLTAEFAARHPDRFGGAIILSGGLIGPQGTKWDYPGSLASTPVFLGCSDVDPHIPKARVDESAVVLGRRGAQVTKRIYPGMGHTVHDDEIAFTRVVMDGILASAPR